GKSAMVPMGPWIYSYRTSGDVAKKILEEETGVTPLPLPPGGVQATYLEVKPISINAFSKDKKDAWDLVKLLTSKEFVATANRIKGVNRIQRHGVDGFHRQPRRLRSKPVCFEGQKALYDDRPLAAILSVRSGP